MKEERFGYETRRVVKERAQFVASVFMGSRGHPKTYAGRAHLAHTDHIFRTDVILNVPRYEECRLLGCYAVWFLQEPTLCSVFRLLITVNAVPSAPILVTLMIEAIRSSETSVPTRSTWRNIPEDAFFRVAAVKTSNAAKSGKYLVTSGCKSEWEIRAGARADGHHYGPILSQSRMRLTNVNPVHYTFRRHNSRTHDCFFFTTHLAHFMTIK
jgi:hypothetical protein